MESELRRRDVDTPNTVETTSSGTFELVEKPNGTELGKIKRTLEGADHDHGTNKKSDIMDVIVAQTLRNKAEALRDTYVRHMESELTNLLDKVLSEQSTMKNSPNTLHPVASFSTPLPKTGPQDKGQFIRKEFVARNSYLTDLFEVPHIHTIQYIFIAVLIFFMANTVIHDLFDHGTIGVDFRTWMYAFSSFPSVVLFWCGMQLTVLLAIYGAMTYWANNRNRSEKIDWFDELWLAAYCLYNVLFFVLPVYFMYHFRLGPGCTGIVIGEQIRLIMKGHAFVREKIPEVLKQSVTKESKSPISFSSYLYFQLIPTLVYRDHYPMNKEVNWKLVTKHFLQFSGGILYLNYIYLRFCVPVFRNFSQDRVNVETFLKSIFECILPGSLLMFVVFYSMLHAWMNAWAEMLRFADRLFYRDWWNCTSFSTYYRTWNIVIHDWLYTYVYCDLYRLCGSKYRHVAMFGTFLLSAVIHEYIIICVLRMFYPVMFVLFAGFGVWMVFVTQKRSSRSWNIVLWLSVFLGQGVLMCMYSSEYYARINCPPTKDGILDYLIPRSWSCYVVHPAVNQTVIYGGV